jgi:HKD family nuclease
MEISFLGQGFSSSDDSVGNVLINSFSDAEFNKFGCLVAFASLSGIDGISEAVKNSKQHIKQFGVVVGIDQKGTSKEALEALLGLDIGTRIYYTISYIIFHPKIYLFEGDKKCRIILGSSNLTQTGLCQNIEASFVIDFTKPDEKGENLLRQIYDYFKSFFDGDIGNLNKLTKELIEKLFEGGIIPDESERSRAQEDKIAQQKETGKAERWNELKTLFPTIGIQKLPNGFIKKEKVTAPIPAVTPTAIAPTQEAATRPAQEEPIHPEIITPEATTAQTTFYMHLNRLQGSTIPGEARISMAARDQAEDFWGWSSEYRTELRSGGKKTRQYKEWKPEWEIIDLSTHSIYYENVRMYEYGDSMDFRFYSPKLVSMGADELDIVRINRIPAGQRGVFKCELAKKGTAIHSQWERLLTEKVRNSNRRFGFTNL